MNTRPTKLNDELIKQFAEEVAEGLPLHYCCDLLGITRMNFSNWYKQGETDYEAEIMDSIYAEFFYQIKKNYAKFIKNSNKKIRNGEDGWQGTAWWLERTNKDFIKAESEQTNETVIVNNQMKVKPNK